MPPPQRGSDHDIGNPDIKPPRLACGRSLQQQEREQFLPDLFGRDRQLCVEINALCRSHLLDARFLCAQVCDVGRRAVGKQGHFLALALLRP